MEVKTDLEFVEIEIAGLHEGLGKREAKPSIRCDKAPKGNRRSWKYNGILSVVLICQHCNRKYHEVAAAPGAKGRYTKEAIERLNRLEVIREQLRGDS